jgi:hypothetical protein
MNQQHVERGVRRQWQRRERARPTVDRRPVRRVVFDKLTLIVEHDSGMVSMLNASLTE